MVEIIPPPLHITLNGIDASQSDMSPEGTASVFVRLSERPNDAWSQILLTLWRKADHSHAIAIDEPPGRSPNILLSVTAVKETIVEAYGELAAMVNVTNAVYAARRDEALTASQSKDRARDTVLAEIRKAADEIGSNGS